MSLLTFTQGKNYKIKSAWGFYLGPLCSCFHTDPTHSSSRAKSRTEAYSQAVRSGMFNLGTRGSQARRLFRAGRSSPDALGAENQARPLRVGAEAHAVEPDQPRGHRARRRAACGESTGAVTASPAIARELCRPPGAYPCPDCGSDRPTSRHGAMASDLRGPRFVTAPPQRPAQRRRPRPPGNGVRPRLCPCLPPTALWPALRPLLTPRAAPWSPSELAARPTELGQALLSCSPCSPSSYTNMCTTTSGIPVEVGHSSELLLTGQVYL